VILGRSCDNDSQRCFSGKAWNRDREDIDITKAMSTKFSGPRRTRKRARRWWFTELFTVLEGCGSALLVCFASQ
jgi:hypothetical protein